MPETKQTLRQTQGAEQSRSIKIKAKDEDLKGAFANIMRIFHTKEEFILDFFLVPPPEEGILTSRVILTPGHVKRMSQALQENISKYEEKFGKIEEIQPEGEIGFKT